MEAIAGSLLTIKMFLCSNGWFSFRWSQFFKETLRDVKVLSASPSFENFQAPFKPVSLDEIIQYIHESKPSVVFAPHVETSADYSTG